jgi:hypothetical protein
LHLSPYPIAKLPDSQNTNSPDGSRDTERRRSDRRRRTRGLSAALRLAQLQKAERGEPLAIAVLEKAREAGGHMLSGTLLDPRALKELVPDFEAKGAPLAVPVHDDRVYFLTSGSSLKFPLTPPPLANHGNYIISLNKFAKWLASQVEAEGSTCSPGLPAPTSCMKVAGRGAQWAIGVWTSTARGNRLTSQEWTSARR